MHDRVRGIVNIEEKIKGLEKNIKSLKYIIIFLVIIIAILTIVVIGEYVGIWGGVFIEDPNYPGLPYTLKIYKFVKFK